MDNFNIRKQYQFFVMKHYFILIFCLISSTVCYDFCQIEKEKCKSPHIGCNETAITFEVNPNCSNIEMINLNNNIKNYILKTHNELRDKLAAGNVENYPPASRMLEMYWDEELEATACEHAQYCVFRHDKCRASPSYDYPGQNLRKSHYINYPQTNIKKELYNGITDWFNEYADVAPDIIENYENRPNHKAYGHFTVMAKDNNDRIGCCYITYENYDEFSDTTEYSHFFTCNYRETNLINRSVYKIGNATTSCNDFGFEYTPSLNYTHLCTNKLIEDELVLEDEPEIENDQITDLETDYCELGKIKCGRNKHIGCKNESGFEINSACMNIEVHNMSEYRELLLKEHNKYRNLIASGEYRDFPSATKMIQMEWDVQLEQVACEHVKYCQVQPAQCLATMLYDMPGHSYYNMFSSSKRNNHVVLKKAIQNWFNQSSAASSNIVDDYEEIGPDYYGSFGLMINEAQQHTGCCFITYEENHNDYIWKNHFLTCVYENLNFLHSQLYTKGETASECDDYGDDYTTSDVYPNLCVNMKNKNDSLELFNSESEQSDINGNLSYYCQIENEKCDGRRHIKCEIDPGLEMNPACTDIKVVNFTEKMRELVLNIHNDFRNQIAGGEIEEYPTATKMLQTEWDTELAELACEHLKYCSNKQDECHATALYDNPGQSIFTMYSNMENDDYEMVLFKGLNYWFLQHKNVNSDIINSFEVRSPAIYHSFLLMVKEINNKIGCCYIKSKLQMNANSWFSHMFTCNYREDNSIGNEIYSIGEPASECDQWGSEYNKSKIWDNLCDVGASEN
uniref:CSON007728 protein n=1 Tax=Culicoides sonorensis TaxID=179676 RepID=A0A336LY23_CULSO